MGCEKRPYLCGILVLGSLALFFHIVGFVTPGWLILRRSMTEDESIFEVKGQLIDHGGEHPPPEFDKENPMFRRRRSRADQDSDSDDVNEEHHHPPPGHNKHQNHPHHGEHRPHHGPKPGPHHRPHTGNQKPTKMSDEGFDDVKEDQTVEAWMMEATSELETFDVRTSFGLWYSKVCVHKERKGNHNSEEKHDEDEEWSADNEDSEDDDKRKKHCQCKKVSTKSALRHAFIYESNLYLTKAGGILSYNNFGYASLTEHRVENCVVLAFLVLGLISAIAGFRKVNGCKCAGAACVIFMLFAAFLAILPVARLSHYSVIKTRQSNPVYVHSPYSVIATGLGAVFSLITAMVAGYGFLAKSRKGNARGWYQFNNEMELPNEKKEKPNVYICAEALPAKPGLYDVCDFSDIKPVEEVKKPVEKEEPEEFVL